MADTELQLSDEEWRSRLDPARYRILRHQDTEPPWSGAYLHVDGEGVFRCAGCGAPLFTTDAKFDSGSGWPSFDRVAAAGTVLEHTDDSHGMVRTEVVCARCGGHLGHRFPDGPTPTGVRYCINSLALDFEPAAGGGDREAASPAP